MKFKPAEEVEERKSMISKELYDGVIDLIQFEIDKINLIYSAYLYFDCKGFCGNAKFLKSLLNKCEANKDCIIHFLLSMKESVPELKVPELKNDFKDDIEPFKLLSEKEEEYSNRLDKLISISFEDKNWKAFGYLLNKMSEVKGLCLKALSAVENDKSLADLIPCEPHTLAK